MEISGSGTATASGAGAATITIRGPHRPGYRWELTTVVVQSVRVGDGTYPTATVYRSVVSPAYAIGTSRAADRVTFAAEGDWLLPGDSLVIVLAGCAPGSTASAAMFGREVRA